MVAAVGNGGDAPSKPWRFAGYPAALPHVLGVGAYGRTGDVPSFSNRDDVYVDISAPGQDMLSLLPRSLTRAYSSCPEQGYSSCGPKEYRGADGTSFSSPQVSAAAAMLLRAQARACDPTRCRRSSSEVADDATPADGCGACTVGRDELDRQRPARRDSRDSLSAAGSFRAPDRFEPNDDIGPRGAGRLRQGAARPGHARQLGRPERRLPHQASAGARGSPCSSAPGSSTPRSCSGSRGCTALALATDQLRARRSIHPAGVPERLVYRARASRLVLPAGQAREAGLGPYSIRIAS